MSLIASVWLFLSLALCAFAWMAGRRFAALTLPLAVVITAFAIQVITGLPRLTSPPAGHYTVLGAKIEVNVAIWALLEDSNGAVRYYKLPYSSSQADQLQQALDGAETGQGVKATIDGEGGQTYDGDPPVQGTEAKTPETPALTLP